VRSVPHAAGTGAAQPGATRARRSDAGAHGGPSGAPVQPGRERQFARRYQATRPRCTWLRSATWTSSVRHHRDGGAHGRWSQPELEGDDGASSASRTLGRVLVNWWTPARAATSVRGRRSISGGEQSLSHKVIFLRRKGSGLLVK
jgi:hypothetical protein